MLKDLSKYKHRILEKSEAILPKTTWYQGTAKDVAEPPSPVTTIQKGGLNIGG
jgi:hypothetical protein